MGPNVIGDEAGRSLRCMEVRGGNQAVEMPLELAGLSAAILGRPHGQAQAGGDVHYVSSCGTGRITRLTLADVAGHGEPAAALADHLRLAMQRQVNHIEPHKLARELNGRLFAQEEANGRFATALIMTYFAPTGSFSLCNAGHPPPILYRQVERRWAPIDPAEPDERITNLPLGVLEAAGYTGCEFQLSPGDVVLAYTDCLMDARDGQNRTLGVEGLSELLNELLPTLPTQDPLQLLRVLVPSIEARGYALNDDLTVAALCCRGRDQGAPMIERLKATLRVLPLVCRHGCMPWPELSIRNVGGALYAPLNRVRPRRRRFDAGKRP